VGVQSPKRLPSQGLGPSLGTVPKGWWPHWVGLHGCSGDLGLDGGDPPWPFLTGAPPFWDVQIDVPMWPSRLGSFAKPTRSNSVYSLRYEQIWTGAPKRVCWSHQSAAASASATQCRATPLTQPDRVGLVSVV
jgi:hypothetical protein